ncbi:hypothetical protein C2R22_15115 [Salinigranum rubrum]|uniref:Uncharacterized protein n=1 Tax=Salinigranum rubrum TaxID=755307 RepID=A0A2I8VLP2_9EURY|nr:hypothetical protein C2R22_15115 [Salinigranum rubrum]
MEVLGSDVRDRLLVDQPHRRRRAREAGVCHPRDGEMVRKHAVPTRLGGSDLSEIQRLIPTRRTVRFETTENVTNRVRPDPR